MTQATFVRLDTADLAGMAKRLGAILTDEGAHAWYKHDVAELLQEVVALRQEYQAARQYFFDDDVHSPAQNVTLAELAEMWKGQASGLWEKAQVKKLRAETVQAKQDLAETESKLAGAEHAIRDLVQGNTELQTRLDSTIRAYDAKLAEMRDQRTGHVDRIVELETTVSALMDDNAAVQARVAEAVKNVERLCADRIAEVRGILARADTVLAT